MEENQWSQTANSFARVVRTGSCSGAKHFIGVPQSAEGYLPAKLETNPLLSILGSTLPTAGVGDE
jgi:hypothetical protein